MPSFRLLNALLFFFIGCGLSCTTVRSRKAGTTIEFVGSYEIPFELKFRGTTVGGLSGIDYDRKNDIYYLICDDRSDIEPSRFYTAKIHLTEKGIDSIEFLSVDTLLQPNGLPFPSGKLDPAHAADPESIRYDAIRQQLVWSSEGERMEKGDSMILQDPFIYLMSKKGRFLDSFQLPNKFRMHANESGPRRNGVLEGLSFDLGYQNLFVSLEEPMYEDGPRAGTGDSSGMVRILQMDANTKKIKKQLAYQLEPVPYPPEPPGAFKVNGISEILSVDKDHMLVMERSFSTGRKPSSIRIFLADMSKGDEVSGIPSLARAQGWKPVPKTLLINMDSLGIYTDNFEGMCPGPKINGRHTLLLISDNNFSKGQLTQLFLFTLKEN